jgi:hypothetical protein
MILRYIIKIKKRKPKPNCPANRQLNGGYLKFKIRRIHTILLYTYINIQTEIKKRNLAHIWTRQAHI